MKNIFAFCVLLGGGGGSDGDGAVPCIFIVCYCFDCCCRWWRCCSCMNLFLLSFRDLLAFWFHWPMERVWNLSIQQLRGYISLWICLRFGSNGPAIPLPLHHLHTTHFLLIPILIAFHDLHLFALFTRVHSFVYLFIFQINMYFTLYYTGLVSCTVYCVHVFVCIIKDFLSFLNIRIPKPYRNHSYTICTTYKISGALWSIDTGVSADGMMMCWNGKPFASQYSPNMQKIISLLRRKQYINNMKSLRKYRMFKLSKYLKLSVLHHSRAFIVYFTFLFIVWHTRPVQYIHKIRCKKKKRDRKMVVIWADHSNRWA